MKRYLFPLLLLSGTSTLSAQEKETTLEEIQILDKFLNTDYAAANENTIVITKKDLENAPATSIDEILQQYIGLDIRKRGANGVQSDISIRGGSFEQVLLLLNGVKMNDSQTGHNTLNIPVDIADVERIEIIKGPAARRFGQNAYSGVINIVTKTSSNERIKISAELGDYESYGLGASGTFGSEKFSNLLQINSSKSKGYRYNTDYDLSSAFYQNQTIINNGKIKFQGGFSEKKFGANGFYSSPKATEQYEATQASVISAGLEQKFEKIKYNASVFWRRGQDLYLFNRAKPEVYRNLHLGNNLGLEANATYNSSIGTTGFGAEYKKEFLVSNNLGKRERDITTLFAEHHFTFLENKLKVSPGISWAHFSGNQNFFYPGLDIGLDINRNNKLYGNIGKVHRIPTFTDLYYTSNTEQGNVNLLPESALSYEIGYRYNRNTWLASAAFFGKKTSDAIDFVKEREADKWLATNIGKINTKGFEAEIKKTFNNFVQSFSVGYSFLENQAVQQASFSRYISDNFKHQLISKMENKFGKYFTNQIIYRYQQRVTGQSYHLIDEKFIFKYNKLDAFLLINNITNTDYTENFGVPMPKRWFHIGVSYQIDLY